MAGSVYDPKVLKPGEGLEQTAPFGRACDFSRPGKYEILVSRSDPQDPKHHVVESNKLSITVVNSGKKLVCHNRRKMSEPK